MSNADRTIALTHGLVPRAPRLPTDAAQLVEMDPMSATLDALPMVRRDGRTRSAAARDLGAKLHITALIQAALRGE